MPNGTYGGVRGEKFIKNYPLLDLGGTMGRHSSNNKRNIRQNQPKRRPKKSNFKMIFVVVIIAIIGMLVHNSNVKKQPKKIINTAFSDLKTANIEDANKYINYNQLIYSLDGMLAKEDDNEINSAIKKELFTNIEWEVLDVETKNNNAVVTVEMTNKDYIKVITNWMKKMIGEKARGEEITDELLLQNLEATLAETTDTKTETKKVTLFKEKGKWKIIVDEELRNLIYPGIESIATTLNKEISSD